MVATVLDDVERSRLDAAAGEYVSAVHTNDMEEAIRAVREQPINAVLVSPSYVSRRDLMGVARLVREFPGVQTIALVSRPDAQSSERLLELGKSGVQSLVDLSRRDDGAACDRSSARTEEWRPRLAFWQGYGLRSRALRMARCGFLRLW